MFVMVAISGLVPPPNQLSEPTNLCIVFYAFSRSSTGNGLFSLMLSIGKPDLYGVLVVFVDSCRLLSWRTLSSNTCCDRCVKKEPSGSNDVIILVPKKWVGSSSNETKLFDCSLS